VEKNILGRNQGELKMTQQKKLTKICEDARVMHKPTLYKCVRAEYCDKQVSYGQLKYCKIELERNRDSRWGGE